MVMGRVRNIIPYFLHYMILVTRKYAPEFKSASQNGGEGSFAPQESMNQVPARKNEQKYVWLYKHCCVQPHNCCFIPAAVCLSILPTLSCPNQY